MRKRWKNLSYRKKIVLNLLVIALWAFGAWMRAGYPLPTAEMEFRRMERQGVLPESEIVFLSEREDAVFAAADGMELVVGDAWAVGLREDTVVYANLGRQKPWRLTEIPRERDGCTLVPLTYMYYFGYPESYWVDEYTDREAQKYTYRYFSPFVLVDVPPEAARAELTVTGEYGEDYVGRGWDLGDGIWLLGIEKEDHWDGWYHEGSPYTLRLFDGAGSLIFSRESSIP